MSDSEKKMASRRDVSSSYSNMMSKNELYTPYVAYDQDETTAEQASRYMLTRKSGVPNSLRESSLVEFWQSVSVDYHRNASYHDATNNGSRPLARKHVEDKIKQRALTLTGGGFSTALGKGGNKTKKWTNTSTRPVGIKSKRQMKKIIKASRNKPGTTIGTNNPTRCEGLRSPSSDKGKIWSAEVFQKLNNMWIKYAQSLLPPCPEEKPFCMKDYSSSLSKGSFARRMATAELVGAKVGVSQCAAHPSLVGKSGIVVEAPKTCWKVAIFRTQNKATASESSAPTWKVSVVPKNNSTLTIRVPLPKSKDQSVRINVCGRS